MTQSLAKAISWIFHPVWMPIFTFFIILYCFPFHYQYIPYKMYNITLFVLVLLTVIAPSILILIIYKLDIVSDIDIHDRRQRILPYMVFILFYLMAYLIIKPKTHSSIIFMEDPLLASVLLGAVIALSISFFINNFLKVSVHTLASSIMFAFTLVISNYTNRPLFFINVMALIILGLVGASRIYLRAHTPREVYAAIIIGFVGLLIGFYLFF